MATLTSPQVPPNTNQYIQNTYSPRSTQILIHNIYTSILPSSLAPCVGGPLSSSHCSTNHVTAPLIRCFPIHSSFFPSSLHSSFLLSQKEQHNRFLFLYSTPIPPGLASASSVLFLLSHCHFSSRFLVLVLVPVPVPVPVPAPSSSCPQDPSIHRWVCPSSLWRSSTIQ